MKAGMGVTPEFERAVHALVATIPTGKVMSYGQIAELCGMPGGGREVGHIMSRVQAGSSLPCHRVVNRTGAMSPDFAFGGHEHQRAMLKAEGVRFNRDGCIDMVRHQWCEHEQLTRDADWHKLFCMRSGAYGA